MARKNKARKSQPIGNRTPVASRRFHETRPKSDGPALALSIRRVAKPSPLGVVKRQSSRTIFADVKPSINRGPIAPSSLPVSAKQVRAPVRKPKQVSTETSRHHSKLSLAVTPEPDVRKSSEKARDVNRCKTRPDSKKAARSKGGGGGKRFVPWC